MEKRKLLLFVFEGNTYAIMKGDENMFKNNIGKAKAQLEEQYQIAVSEGDLESANEIMKQLNLIKENKKSGININEVLKIGAGLAGTVMVLLWEEHHVIGSKVFGTVFKKLF